jgi:hypothetical protein
MCAVGNASGALTAAFYEENFMKKIVSILSFLVACTAYGIEINNTTDFTVRVGYMTSPMEAAKTVEVQPHSSANLATDVLRTGMLAHIQAVVLDDGYERVRGSVTYDFLSAHGILEIGYNAETSRLILSLKRNPKMPRMIG